MIQTMETVEIYLPNYNHIIDLAIGHADESNIETAPEYAHAKSIVFYGNSITQGEQFQGVKMHFLTLYLKN